MIISPQKEDTLKHIENVVELKITAEEKVKLLSLVKKVNESRIKSNVFFFIKTAFAVLAPFLIGLYGFENYDMQIVLSAFFITFSYVEAVLVYKSSILSKRHIFQCLIGMVAGCLLMVNGSQTLNIPLPGPWFYVSLCLVSCYTHEILRDISLKYEKTRQCYAEDIAKMIISLQKEGRIDNKHE